MKILRREYKTDNWRHCTYCNAYTSALFVFSGEKFANEGKCGRYLADMIVDKKRGAI